MRCSLNMLEVGKRRRISDLQFGENKLTCAFHKSINIHVKKAVLRIRKSENTPPILFCGWEAPRKEHLKTSSAVILIWVSGPQRRVCLYELYVWVFIKLGIKVRNLLNTY